MAEELNTSWLVITGTEIYCHHLGKCSFNFFSSLMTATVRVCIGTSNSACMPKITFQMLLKYH